MYTPQFSRIFCEEVAQQVPDKKVFFFTSLDYLYYQRCGYDPPSYEQPLGFSILKAPLITELGGLLDKGYTIALVRTDGMSPLYVKEYAASLAAGRVLVRADSAHYSFVSRAEDAKELAPPAPSPRPRRRRPARANP